MIYDRLAHASFYQGLPPLFVRGLRFLTETDLVNLPLGRHDIDGDRLFAMSMEYETRAPADCAWEAHEKYWDIQTMARGSERFGFQCKHAMQIDKPYDAEKDVAFFRGNGDFLEFHPGSFLVMMPHDAHMPCIALNASQRIKKVVVKVALG